MTRCFSIFNITILENIVSIILTFKKLYKFFKNNILENGYSRFGGKCQFKTIKSLTLLIHYLIASSFSFMINNFLFIRFL